MTVNPPAEKPVTADDPAPGRTGLRPAVRPWRLPSSAVPGQRWRDRSWQRQALDLARVALALLWVAWLALAWWIAPRPADADQAARDGAGADGSRVVSFVRADGWHTGVVLWTAPKQPAVRADGNLLVWSTTDGRTRYLAAHDVPEALIDQAGGWDPYLDGVAGRLSAAEHGSWRDDFDHRPIEWLTQAAAVLLIVAFLTVLLSPYRPARGTRFFWFWVVAAPPGLGLLAWLWLERPWRSAAADRPDSGADPAAPAGTRKLLTGFDGVLIAIVASIVLSLLAIALRWVFGPGLIPG